MSDSQTLAPQGQHALPGSIAKPVQYHNASSEVTPPSLLITTKPILVDGRSSWNYLTLAGAWVVQFCTFGYVNAFGVYQDFYTRQLLPNSTQSDISWIGSLQLFLMYAPGLLVGSVFDNGYFHYLEIGGATTYILSIFMLSFVRQDQYWQAFVAQAIGMGIGVGMTFLPSLSIVSQHFKAYRALAIGIAASGSSVGGIVFPIILNRLFQNPYMGFAGGVRISGALIAVMLLGANMIMRTNCASNANKPTLTWSLFKTIACNGAYLWSILGAFLTNLGMFVPFFYYQLYTIDKGISPSLASNFLTILNAGSIVGRLVPTALADRLGVYTIMLPSMFISATILFGILGLHNGPGAVMAAVSFGLSTGAYVSLIPSLLAMMCKEPTELGVRMGFAFSLVSVANLIGNPIAGELLGKSKSTHDNGSLTWWKALALSGVCLYAGLLFMSISAFSYKKASKHS